MQRQSRYRQLLAGARSYSSQSKPIIHIDNATFYRRYPSQNVDSHNPPIFPSLSFALPSSSPVAERWAVIGPSNSGKSTFFQILRGHHICIPPASRSFPYLSLQEKPHHRHPQSAIRHVGFDGENGTGGRVKTKGAYLSARYESRREDDDFSVRKYLMGRTELNASDDGSLMHVSGEILERRIRELNLQALIDMPMGNLSNGQSRRARIAKALLSEPLVLLLDEPFMGLDPPTVKSLSALLQGFADSGNPHLILSLRPQDPLPDWITHEIHIGENLKVSSAGPRRFAEGPFANSRNQNVPASRKVHDASEEKLSREGLPLQSSLLIAENDEEPLVSMKGVEIKYGDRTILGDWNQTSNLSCGQDMAASKGLFWNVRRGERWGVFGPNGSGKTTLISLICSDHPQAYSQPIEIFGRSRLPSLGQIGISIFDIQSRIGQSSPEIHAFFPKQLTLTQTLESAWADTFLGAPKLSQKDVQTVDTCLRWFQGDLDPASPSPMERKSRSHGALTASTQWAERTTFGQASFSAQRLALFLRALIRKNDLIVLDEAFSGMDKSLRDKCMLFLTWGTQKMLDSSEGKGGIIPFSAPVMGDRALITGLSQDQALICVSHVKEEVPGVVRQWLRLPEPDSGEIPRFGTLDRPLEADERLWDEIWGLKE